MSVGDIMWNAPLYALLPFCVLVVAVGWRARSGKPAHVKQATAVALGSAIALAALLALAIFGPGVLWARSPRDLDGATRTVRYLSWDAQMGGYQ